MQAIIINKKDNEKIKSSKDMLSLNVRRKIFIEDCVIMHGDKYDYSKSFYINDKKKIDIMCKIHGIFSQTPNKHKRGAGCPTCYAERKNLNNEKFIKRSVAVHGNKYDYSKVVYVNSKAVVDIICKKHGLFSQKPEKHMIGNGCMHCFVESMKSNKKDFIVNAKKIHGNKYDYQKVVYVNCKKNIDIVCKQHGVFSQRVSHHLNGSGCPKCANEQKESKKLQIIDKVISVYKYEREKTFTGCRLINLLRIDRYIPELNLAIEFDGEQHFKAKKIFGGETEFILTKKRDRRKTRFCRDNDINLLRIKYNQDPEKEIEKIIALIKANHGIIITRVYGRNRFREKT